MFILDVFKPRYRAWTGRKQWESHRMNEILGNIRHA